MKFRVTISVLNPLIRSPKCLKKICVGYKGRRDLILIKRVARSLFGVWDFSMVKEPARICCAWWLFQNRVKNAESFLFLLSARFFLSAPSFVLRPPIYRLL